MRDSDHAWSKVVDHDESIVKAWRVESGDEREANGRRMTFSNGSRRQNTFRHTLLPKMAVGRYIW